MKFSLQHNRIQLSQSTFLYGLVKRREIEDPVRDRDKEKGYVTPIFPIDQFFSVA